MSFGEWWKENYPNLNNADAMLVASKAYVDQKAKIDRLEKQLEEAEKHLRIYACGDNWFQSTPGGRKDKIFQGDTEHTYFTRCESNYIGGKRAREYFRNKGCNENKARP